MAEPYRVDIDAQDMRFDPSDPDFYDKITKDIPSFEKYEAHNRPVKIRIFAWIACMYDPHSPLRREIKDMYQRKTYAASLVGVNPMRVSKKYQKYIEDILLGIDEEVNKLIVDFIVSFSSQEYMQLLVHEALQHSLMRKIIAGKAKKDDQTMFDTSTEKVKGLVNLLYGSGERDEVYEARRALYSRAAADLSDMRAENVAKRVAEEGRLPDDWGPYGDYMPGEIRFEGDDVLLAEDDEELV